MNHNKSLFIVSSDYEIIPRKREKAYPVLISDWEYLKKKISRIESTGLFLHTVGSVLLGIAGAASLAILTLPLALPQVSNHNIAVCWVVFTGALVGGGLTLYIAYERRKTTASFKEDALDEMIRLEGRYGEKERS